MRHLRLTYILLLTVKKKKKKKKKNLIVKFYAFLLFFKTGEIRVIFHFKQSMQHTILHFN